MDPVYSSHLAVTSSTLTTVLLFYGIRWLLKFTLARQRLGHPQELAFPQRRERAESGLGDPAPSAEAWSAAAVSESPGGARGRGLPLCSLPAISFFKQNKSIYVLWETTLPKLSLAAHSAVTLLRSAPEGVGTPGAAWQFSGRVILSPGLRQPPGPRRCRGGRNRPLGHCLVCGDLPVPTGLAMRAAGLMRGFDGDKGSKKLKLSIQGDK